MLVPKKAAHTAFAPLRIEASDVPAALLGDRLPCKRLTGGFASDVASNLRCVSNLQALA
jgi:hypothetical protein